jgi:hypothetical protein
VLCSALRLLVVCTCLCVCAAQAGRASRLGLYRDSGQYAWYGSHHIQVSSSNQRTLIALISAILSCVFGYQQCVVHFNQAMHIATTIHSFTTTVAQVLLRVSRLAFAAAIITGTIVLIRV